MNKKNISTSSEIYSEEYYLTDCDGFSLFNSHRGEKLSTRLAYAWEISNVQCNMMILDIGVGRGETIFQGHKIGAKALGIDYSTAAVRIANSVISKQNLPTSIIQADAKSIPFQNDIFDRILMFDVVEHLHRWELIKVYQEAWRMLKPGGQIIIHTTPNLWYYRFGYPVYRLFEAIRGNTLPSNPRDRFRYHSTHVNEQSIFTLRRDLTECGFQVKSWLAHIPKESNSLPGFIELISPLLFNLPPWRWIFRNDVFAIATKVSQ